MLIYILCDDLNLSQNLAIEAAERRGWTQVEIKRSKRLDPDVALIEDVILRNTAETAAQEGSAIVVYADEIADNT